MQSRLTYLARIAYVGAAWLYVAGVLSIVFMAGMSLFSSAALWALHRELGYTIGFLVPIFIVLALVGRLPRRQVPLLSLLLILYIVQTILPVLRTSVPAVAALHPVNAMLVFVVALVHARRSRELVQLSQPMAAPIAS